MRHAHQVSEELEQWGGNAITLKSGHLGVACGAPYGLMWACLCLGRSCGMLYLYGLMWPIIGVGEPTWM